MAATYQNLYRRGHTPQSEKARDDQVPNRAGGFVWGLDCWGRLDRFLIIGSDTNTYYASARTLTRENVQSLDECLEEDAHRTIERVIEISQGGRAPKNDAAIFALALAVSGGHAKMVEELDAVAKVCRTATHMFTFLDYVLAQRGWNRSLRRLVVKWYLSNKTPDELAYQVAKYPQRGGRSHLSVLRCAHPKTEDPAVRAIFGHIAGTETSEAERDAMPAVLRDYLALQAATSESAVLGLLAKNSNLSWEMIPQKFQGSKEVWRTILPNLPITALIRNLGRMTANETLVPLSREVDTVVARLSDQERIVRGRIHPITVLMALQTYGSGKGLKGRLTWMPDQQIQGALDRAFDLSFGSIDPTNRKTVVALDVSGSMTFSGAIPGAQPLAPRDASAAMAMAVVRTEPHHHVLAFGHSLVPVGITPRDSLADAVRKVSDLPFGGTDCALPMMWAIENKVPAEAFIVYTDSETWAGTPHPAEALQRHRKARQVDSKLIVCGMASNGFTIADPNDSGMMDIVGFDSAAPRIMSDFIRG